MITSLHLSDLELDALQKNLSNEARVLYLLYLSKEFSPASQKVTIKNQRISALLNSSNNAIITRGRQINALLIELNAAGLIATEEPIDRDKTTNNQSVSLPLKKVAQSTEYFSIKVDWRPAKTDVEQLSTLVGLIDATYTNEELGEFIAYWITRDEIQMTSFQWTQKLVTFLKKRRLHTPKHHEDSKRGHQYATPKVGVHTDDKVKRFVEKYKK